NDEGMKSFMPNGFKGVMMAVSGVFFAYIGFDAVSVLAEESKNPQRDLPRGMIYSLVICTIVYILLTLVLTGAVHYKSFEGVGDPLAFIFESNNLNVGWMQMLVAIAAVVAMTSVLLVFQMGQPRIWMSMSRDGLMPKIFQRIHPNYNTPSFSTILTGLVVGVPILFTDKTFVLDFTSIATLFAFVLVCGGVLLIPAKQKQEGKFHLPYINGQLIFPILVILSIWLVSWQNADYWFSLFHFDYSDNAEYVAGKLSFFDLATPNISLIAFWMILIVLSIMSIVKKYSLIPLLGLGTCLYLLTGMTKSNWVWFLGWLLLGLVIYFLYGFKHSKLKG
ncbi:MAG: APC family permease, partial [Bacteroidota bacterium]